jgi:hypothetical protein
MRRITHDFTLQARSSKKVSVLSVLYDSHRQTGLCERACFTSKASDAKTASCIATIFSIDPG